MRLIDADALLEKYNVKDTNIAECLTDKEMARAFERFCIIADAVEKQPTVDAAPVVRCRECKYAHLTYDGDIKYCDLLAVKDEYGDCDPCFYRSGDWFCADGERKDGAE